MQLYSEYHEGDRRATVTYIRQSEWARELDKWEVAFYVNGKPIQRTTCRSQFDAEQIAEDFCQGFGTAGPSLLNEHISNG
jgi:hypothetical protein